MGRLWLEIQVLVPHFIKDIKAPCDKSKIDMLLPIGGGKIGQLE